MKIRYNHGGVKSKWNSKWLIIFPHLPTFHQPNSHTYKLKWKVGSHIQMQKTLQLGWVKFVVSLIFSVRYIHITFIHSILTTHTSSHKASHTIVKLWEILCIFYIEMLCNHNIYSTNYRKILHIFYIGMIETTKLIS
jgi:hypothetical protein